MSVLDYINFNGARYDIRDAKAQAMVAPTEASSTASAAHAAGSYFIYGGVLYRATADIAQGGSIITSGSGQNCEAVQGGLSADVADIKSTVEKYEYINLLQNISMTKNTVLNTTTGATSYSSVYDTTDYIPIGNETKIYFSRHRITCFYDAQKAYQSQNANFGAVVENAAIDIPKGAKYFRTIIGYDWENPVVTFGVIPKKNEYTVDVNGSGNFTSFSEALISIDTNQVKDAIVYVKPGEYNIYNEMKAIYGNDYWDNFSDDSPYELGLPFGRGIKIIGSYGAVLKMINPDATNAVVQRKFSILMSKWDANFPFLGGTVENLVFDCADIRYAIHIDIQGSTGEVGGIWHVKDCTMRLDNSANGTWLTSRCIGSGAGGFTTHIFENCDCYPTFHSGATHHAALSWHNRDNSSPKSKVIIKDCYCANGGTILIEAIGSGTNKNPAIVTNNAIGESVIITLNGTTNNINPMVWNNYIYS